ncbi:MAG: hypothetical protein BWY47_01588 [Bacteroidetes bacterium ADurb.Bin302]|nr:MAG: hypothetical protein BWY47_01588 [Bacteroidetes bacterium ADurb.Bin302]
MRQIKFVNPTKESKKISEIKIGDMFKTTFDTTDLRTNEVIFAGAYFTKVASNLEIDWNAVTNSGILCCLNEDLHVEGVNSTLLIEK